MAEIVIRISERTQRIAGFCLGVILLISLLMASWSSGMFAPKYQLRVYAPDVNGLRVGTQVRLDGIAVGSVNAIGVARESSDPERRIEIALRIDKRFQDAIRMNSSASVMVDGLLADPYLNIRRGFDGAVIAPNGEVRFEPTYQLKFKDFTNGIKYFADCVQAAKTSKEITNGPNTPPNPKP